MSASSSSQLSIEQRILARLSTADEEAIPFERLKREFDLGSNGGDGIIRQLAMQNRVRLHRGTNGDRQIYISVVNDISEQQSLVLDAVRASGESGIDQTQLLNKVRIPKTELGKALTTLASKNLIKEHRSFTNRAKRIYTLFHIDPSAHVTGGTMYCGEELDTAFVDEWRRELVSYISTRRMVSFDQIKRHVEAVQSASGGGSSSSAIAGGVGGVTPPVSPLVVTMIDSASARSATSLPSSSGNNNNNNIGGVAGGSGTAKQLSEVDLRTVVQTLVLDGVVEMLIPDSQEEVSTPQYQIAYGQNVMRHFTVRQRPWQPASGRGGNTGMEGEHARQRVRRDGMTADSSSNGGSGGGGPATLPDIEHDNIRSTITALRQSSLWEPAPISQPSAQDAVDGWSYMAAVGFPCVGCPQLERCSVSGRGVINPKGCVYLKDWLS